MQTFSYLHVYPGLPSLLKPCSFNNSDHAPKRLVSISYEAGVVASFMYAVFFNPPNYSAIIPPILKNKEMEAQKG